MFFWKKHSDFVLSLPIVVSMCLVQSSSIWEMMNWCEASPFGEYLLIRFGFIRSNYQQWNFLGIPWISSNFLPNCASDAPWARLVELAAIPHDHPECEGGLECQRFYKQHIIGGKLRYQYKYKQTDVLARHICIHMYSMYIFHVEYDSSDHYEPP